MRETEAKLPHKPEAVYASAVLEDDPIVCRSCGRVGAHIREVRDGTTFIVCKCGEDLEELECADD